MQEMDELVSVGKQFGVNVDDLAGRIYEMPYVQKIAILEVITRFWSSPAGVIDSLAGLLEERGARVLKSE